MKKINKETITEEEQEEYAIEECNCIGCGLNLLQLIGLTETNHLLFRCGSCGKLQLLSIEGGLTNIELSKSKKFNSYLG